MKIQNFVPNTPVRNLPAAGPSVQAQDTPPPGDKVELNSQPTPPPQPPKRSVETGRVLTAALAGAAAMAIPTAIGMATGPIGAAVLAAGGATAGILGGKVSGFITIDFRAPAALALGGGMGALALAGHAFGGPGVAVAALAGGAAMTALMLRN